MRTPGKKQSDASSFREVIALAIKREEDAAAGYQDMMKTVRDRGARAFLSELRDEEQMHKKLLQDLSRGRIAEAGAGRVPDLGLSDFLVDEPPGGDMGYQDILIFAARKEQKAIRFYTILAAKAAGSEERKLFELLAAKEMDHKLRLETEYESRYLVED